MPFKAEDLKYAAINTLKDAREHTNWVRGTFYWGGAPCCPIAVLCNPTEYSFGPESKVKLYYGLSQAEVLDIEEIFDDRSILNRDWDAQTQLDKILEYLTEIPVIIPEYIY